MDKSELLNRIRTTHGELEEVVAMFKPNQAEVALLPGGWSLKSSLAHIEFWERWVLGIYNDLRAGRNPEQIGDDQAMDATNQRVFEESRARSFAEVQRSEREAYQALLALVEQASDAELFDERHFAWTEGEPFLNFIEGNANDHYPEHIASLRQALAGDARGTGLQAGAAAEEVETAAAAMAAEMAGTPDPAIAETIADQLAADATGTPASTATVGRPGRGRGQPMLDAAREFLTANGRDIDRARFEFHFGLGVSMENLLEVLSRYQNPDGGFFGLEVDIKAPVSSPFATELALVIARWAGVPVEYPLMRRALAYLEDTQGEDGTWRFSHEIYEHDLAPWFQGWSWPNLNPSCTLAGLLRQLGLGSDRLHERVQVLFDRLANPRDLVDGDYYTVHPYAYFFQAEWTYPLADLYRWGVVWWLVRQHYTNPEMDATHFIEYAPMPTSAIARRLPAVVLSDQLDRLMNDQQADGGWQSPYSAAWRPWITVNNLLSLRAYRRI